MDDKEAAERRPSTIGGKEMTAELIGPIVKDAGQKVREAAKRKRLYEQLIVADGDVENRKKDGWTFSKKLKNHKTRIQKALPIETQLENRAWLRIYLMGYHELGDRKRTRLNYRH